MDKDTEKKLEQLQLFEQNLQAFLAQKQLLQTEIMELENALKELENCKGVSYKITGPVMISSDKTVLIKELKEKKEIVDLRIKNITKQEEVIRKKAENLQKEVMEKLRK